jgi:hypothetical protein
MLLRISAGMCESRNEGSLIDRKIPRQTIFDTTFRKVSE